MQKIQLIMGMTVTIEVADRDAREVDIDRVFDYFSHIDERFSTYKDSSEISRINRGELGPRQYSNEMREVFALAEQTKRETNGYFDIKTPSGALDPSGVVKGWAIQNAALLLLSMGYKHFFIDAGGDIVSRGANADGRPWSVGIKHPFEQDKIAKIVYPRGLGVATSGTYIRGQHIYDPHRKGAPLTDIVSLTVIGPDVLEADRFATAAFAMEKDGITFIEELEGFEAYAIDANKTATMTSGFERYVAP